MDTLTITELDVNMDIAPTCELFDPDGGWQCNRQAEFAVRFMTHGCRRDMKAVLCCKPCLDDLGTRDLICAECGDDELWVVASVPL